MNHEPIQGCRAVHKAVVVLACCLAATASQLVQAQTFTVLHTFTGGSDGGNPRTGLMIDQGGNFYGTAFSGGGFGGGGLAFKFTHATGGWILTPIYDFSNGNQGFSPDSVLVQFGGAIYGTNYHGGNNDNGSVFKLRPPATICPTTDCLWNATFLYEFTGEPDGSVPIGGLVFGQDGNIYGSTQYGGGQDNPGTIYELTPSGGGWTETVLYRFTGGSDGSYINGIIMGPDGNFYGTALYGGDGNRGTVFELARSGSGWAFSVLHTFQGGADGQSPTAGLMMDPSGNLYGTTAALGPDGGGTVFELTLVNGSWTFNTVYGFAGQGTCGPYAALTMDSQGSLYGTTYCAGPHTAGTIFKLTNSNGSWVQTVLHTFTDGVDGGFPYSSVSVDANGNTYGTTLYGGLQGTNCLQGCGVLWEVTP
jgi:uncharacterized repeat protein (TIGR03803 family)